MVGYITTVFIGALCVFFGVCNMKGNISSLHFYHRHRVSEEDRPAFGRLVGLGTIMMGASVLLLGVFLFLAETFQKTWLIILGSALLLCGLIVGLGLSFYAMIKYNKGIF